MRDFTFSAYSELIKALKARKFDFLRLEDFDSQANSRVVILRHDVDRSPGKALPMAEIEKRLGVHASYYFRVMHFHSGSGIIKRIAALGHEIGYHYETVDANHGDLDKAYMDFCGHLKALREIYPVKSICAHGNPLSVYDNRDIWKKYGYRELGVMIEPYIDLDFTKVLYITDTGRGWNKTDVNIKDKAINQAQINLLSETYKFNTIFDIINSVRENNLPDKIMINTHPQRWTDQPFFWFKELIMQNIRNYFKYTLIGKKRFIKQK